MLNFRILIPLLFFMTTGIMACNSDAEGTADGNIETLDKNKMSQDSAQRTPDKRQKLHDKDTADVHIALTPTLESLPFYYAERHGLFTRHGISVSTLNFTSQMDADTALLCRTAEVGVTDLIRVRYYYRMKQPRLCPLFQTEGIWMLITHSDARIHKLDGLERKMLAAARFSASDYYGTMALQTTDLPYDDVFRPQVNDYYIRLNMLSLHQVDAAILPEPFASSAIRKGHHRLFTTADSKGRIQHVGCLAAREDWSESDKGKKILEALTLSYNDAAKEINAKGIKACSDILVEIYRMDEETAKHLRLPKYKPATDVTATAQNAADAYLNARGVRTH